MSGEDVFGRLQVLHWLVLLELLLNPRVVLHQSIEGGDEVLQVLSKLYPLLMVVGQKSSKVFSELVRFNVACQLCVWNHDCSELQFPFLLVVSMCCLRLAPEAGRFNYVYHMYLAW